MNDKNHCTRRLLSIQIGVLLGLVACTSPASTSPPTTAVPSVEAPAAATASESVPEAAVESESMAPAAESAAAQFIRLLDSDGDGRVSRQEHAIRASSTFDAMDADHDGKVTVTEMDTLRSQLQGEERTSTADAMAPVDGDHDGVLSSDEHALATRVEFDRADGNHDGFLTLAELEASDTDPAQ